MGLHHHTRTIRDLSGLLAVLFLLAGGVAFVAHRIDLDAERRAAHDALMLLESEIEIAQRQLAPPSVPVSTAAASAADIQGALGFWRAASQAWARGDYATMKQAIDQGYGVLKAGVLGLDVGALKPASLSVLPSAGAAVPWSLLFLGLALLGMVVFGMLDAATYELRVVSGTSEASAEEAARELSRKVKDLHSKGWEGVGMSMDQASEKGPWTVHALLQR